MSVLRSSAFCEKCQAVLFDDSAVGGYSARNNEDDSVEFLMIRGEDDEDDEDVEDDEDDEDDDDAPRKLYIDYSVEDSYPDLDFLSASAAAGCKFCDFLRATALGSELQRELSEAEFEIYSADKLQIRMRYVWQANPQYSPKKKGLRALEIGFRFYYGNGSIERFIACSIESTEGPCARWLRLNINKSGHVLDPTTLAWIQERLDAEPDQPSINPLSDNNTFIPTRLVRVDCEPPRLIETSHIDENVGDFIQPLRYAALSYCWGSPEQARLQLKTERSSLPTRLSGIETHEMTRVLQDAIETCRALSIPYLWIDALCIFQDNVLDWQHESALVGEIYYNAYLTIINLSSGSCTEGFLDRPPAQIEIPFQSTIRPEVCGSYSLRSYGIHSPLHNDYSEIADDFVNSQWITRGWTFQEETMSRNILAFGKSKIHLSCPGHYQTQGDEIIYGYYTFQMAEVKREEGYSDKYKDNCYYDWHQSIVFQFSGRSFTCKNDRFPALSGIAQYFASLLADEYVAGLWKKMLYRGLFWKGISNKSWDTLLGELSNESGAYLAPSWSWASRDYHVEFGFCKRRVYNAIDEWNYQEECRIIETNIASHGPDLFGQIKAASLKITTRIIALPYDLQLSDDEWNLGIVGDPARPFAHCILDWRPSLMEPQREMRMLLLGSAGKVGSDSSVSSDSPSSNTDASGDEDAVTERSHDNDDRWVYGLLIYSASVGTNAFFRVGAFYSMSSDGWGARLFANVPETTVVLI